MVHMCETATASLRVGRFAEHYGRYVVYDDGVAAGLRSGAFRVDVRLRDALRRLSGNPREPIREEPVSRSRRQDHSHCHSRRSASETRVASADDVAVLPEPGARLEHRVEQLERRIETRERGLGGRGVSRLVPRRLTR